MVIKYDINQVAEKVGASLTFEPAFMPGPTRNSWVPKIGVICAVDCVSPLEVVVKEIGQAQDIAKRIGVPIEAPIVARVQYVEGQDKISVQSLDPGYNQKMSAVASYLESKLAPPGREFSVVFYAAPINYQIPRD